MAEASRYSPWRSSWKSASACGSRLMRRDGGEAVEGFAGALLAEIAGDRRGQFLDRDRGAPQPEARRDRGESAAARTGRPAGVRSRVGARGRARSRYRAAMLSDEAQTTPCTSGGRSSPNRACGRRQARPERPVAQDALAHDAGVGEARQQQRIGPDQDAAGHAGDGAARGGAPPDQPAEKGRRQLRDRGERQQPDRGKLRRRRRSDNRGRRGAGSRRSRCGAPSTAARRRRSARRQHAARRLSNERHDDVVRHHDRERYRLDDHHGGRRREPADKGDEREQFECAVSGSASTNMSPSIPPAGKVSRPAMAIGITNKLMSTR